MDMLNGKVLGKILLAVLLGGSILTVSACGKVMPDEGVEQTEAEQTGLTGNTENASDILEEGFEGLPIVYSLDNSIRIMESGLGAFTGDWDKDGVEDTLKIEIAEQEGSDVIRKLELTLSGCPNAYIIENADCDFIDIVSGNFDTDREAEILLLFDMKFAGANGCCGLQLLDKTGSEYVNVADGFFTGFDYTAEVRTGEECGYHVVNDKSGESYFLKEENVWESAIGEVTGWYCLEILQGKEQDYIRLKQYVAGGDMTDHAGDMVTVLSAENGRLIPLNEKCVGRTSGSE